MSTVCRQVNGCVSCDALAKLTTTVYLTPLRANKRLSSLGRDGDGAGTIFT